MKDRKLTPNSTAELSSFDANRRDLVKSLAFASAGILLPNLTLSAYAAATQAEILLTTRCGRVRGYVEHGINIFKGIPYGGDTQPRRFMPAAAELPWLGTRDCLAYGVAAPQRRTGESIDEDCLFLNIWTPAVGDGGKRPILVYIHGGGFNNGSGSDPLYDGSNLCRQGDVVVITLNHRLNAFGYLYLAALGGEAYAQSGNVGQLDLVQALHWVRQHAGHLGGDPNNITVFGQSGGGAKIATLMAMPAAKGLFHRAWTMSGQQVTAAGPRAATQRAERYLDALGLKPKQLAKLAAMPIEKLLEATQVKDFSRIEDNNLYFGPVMDSHTLPRHPFWPDAPDQSATIPMVIGNTRDETRAFLGGDPTNFKLTWEQLPAKLLKQQYVDIDPHVVIETYRKLYPDYTPSEVFFAATTAGRSWRGAIEEAEVRAKQGAPTWAYQLDWGSPLDGGKFRAFHTLDIPLVFNNIAQPNSRTGSSPQAKKLAAQMSSALLAFARSGNPNHTGLPEWKTYSLEKRETFIFDVPPKLANDPRGEERKLFQTVPFVQRGTF